MFLLSTKPRTPQLNKENTHQEAPQEASRQRSQEASGGPTGSEDSLGIKKRIKPQFNKAKLINPSLCLLIYFSFASLCITDL